jgi:hypothetical protein
LRLLRRALDLVPAVPDAGLDRRELLDCIREAARRAGALHAELQAVDAILDLLNHDREPLTAARLLTRRSALCLFIGRDYFGLEDAQAAVRLSARQPRSAEHASATAPL